MVLGFGTEDRSRGRVKLPHRVADPGRLWGLACCEPEVVAVMSNKRDSERDLQAEVDSLRSQLEVYRGREATQRKTGARLEGERQSAEAAARSQSQFLANMSHEIRTPLTAILGYTEVLIEDGDLADAPPARIEHLYTIRRNGQHLLQLLNDILDLAKIEAGHLEIARSAVSLRQLLGDVSAVVRHAAEAKGLTFEVRCGPQLPAKVRTDPTRLRQILLNLVGNAVKFTDEGRIELSVQLLEKVSGGSLLRFTVTDTGPGLAPDAQERVFEAFKQSDSGETRAQGTGLGLTISRQLARALGGDVQLESRPGAGSSFRLTIDPGSLDGVPLLEFDADEPHTSATLEDLSTLSYLNQIREAAQSARLLLVEDGVDNRRLVSYMLGKAGLQVSHAENGAEGLEQALAARDAGEPFDVILMDMQMPVMDGYEATRRLRQADYEGPIIALTAHAMVGDRERCLEAGCDGFATKPIDRRELMRKIVAFLRKPAATRG